MFTTSRLLAGSFLNVMVHNAQRIVRTPKDAFEGAGARAGVRVIVSTSRIDLAAC